MTDPEPDDRLQELLDRYLSAVQSGRPVDRAAWLAAHPELLGWVHWLDALDRLAPAGLPPQPTEPVTFAADPPPAPDVTVLYPRSPGGPGRPAPVPGDRLLGRYEILAELGRGGMGVVYRARQLDLDRVVALKMVSAGSHASPEQLQRFQAEARAAARVRHPNVVQVFEAGHCDGLPYLSMEYIDGPSLAQVLREGRPDLTTAVRWLAAVARAVQHLHDAGIIHRDIKPANVLLRKGIGDRGQGIGEEKTGKRASASPSSPSSSSPLPLSPDSYPLSPPLSPALADFGLARLIESDSGLTGTGAVLGTPSYMAPEQAAGHAREVGPTADVYSLGAVLYELLTGRPPFLGHSAVETLVQVLDQEPIPPRRLDPKVPPVLEEICLACLDKEPVRRPTSAAELAELLEKFAEGEDVLPPPGGPLRAVRRWARREPALASRLVAFGIGTLALNAKYLLTDALVDPARHLQRTLITQAALTVWILLSWLFAWLMARGRKAESVPTLWAAADVTAATVCMVALDGLFSPLTVAYPLLIGTSGLAFRVRQVWFTTACAVLGFIGLVVWTGPSAMGGQDLFRHAFFIGGLGVLGLAVSLLVQRVNVLTRYARARP